VPGPPAPFVFPAIARSVLPNGLRVWTVRHEGVPIVCFMLLVPAGSAADPPGKEGLAALAADMLDEGSGARSAIEVHEDIARIGAHLDTDIGADAVVVSMTALARFAGRALELLADVVARPALREDDFARVRQLRLNRLAQLNDIPSAVADRAFVRLLYGPHPYGHTPIGLESSVAALTADDVRRFHAASIVPDGATLVAAGECDHDAVVRMAAEAFGAWGAGAPSPAGAAGVPDPVTTPVRLVAVPRSGAPQSELRIGHIGAARSTPDYHALVAANMVLGGQFVSRINLNLREEKGFTYGARTSFDFRRMPGPFVLQVAVQSAVTARAIQESIAEIAAIRGPRPVSADELASGVAALTRGYARNFETAEQLARAAVQMALYDLPESYFAEFVPRVEAVTPSDVTRVLAAHLHPDRLITLVVGDFEAVRADLGGLGLGEPVVLTETR